MRAILFSSLVAVLGLVSAAQASVLYDQDITPNVIYGTGNSNGDWAVSTENNVEAALRSHLRYVGTTGIQAGSNIYNQPTGAYTDGNARWNVDFSVYVSSGDLTGVTTFLSMDIDPSEAVDYVTIPISAISDNEVGTVTTAQSGGTVLASGASLAGYTVIQNSWNLGFLANYLESLGIDIGFDPTADATYDFTLSVYGAEKGDLLTSVSIQVIVGDGGAAVPEPATCAIWSLFSGIGLIAGRRRRNRTA
jgi:hypothetical protein